MEMLRLRLAYWWRKLEKLQGMYLALLPVVCPQQAMTNSRLTPAHRAILCEYMFAHLLIYHMTLNAPDLEGRRCLPPQRRTKTRKDVMLYGNAMIKRMMTWAYTFISFIVTDDEETRVVMIGSMGQEHFHAIFRRLCYGDDCVFNFDGSMTRADLMNWLRAQMGLLPQVGASRERTTVGDAHMPAFDGAGVPPIGIIGQCAVMSLNRFGLELPASVKGKLAELGMMPDFDTWGEEPSFLHQLVNMGGPVRMTRCISTTSRRSVNLAGVSKMKLYSTGQQLELRGKHPHRRRVQLRRSSSDEEDV